MISKRDITANVSGRVGWLTWYNTFDRKPVSATAEPGVHKNGMRLTVRPKSAGHGPVMSLALAAGLADVDVALKIRELDFGTASINCAMDGSVDLDAVLAAVPLIAVC